MESHETFKFSFAYVVCIYWVWRSKPYFDNILNKNDIFITLSLLFMLYLAGSVTKDIPRFDLSDYSSMKDNAINKIEKSLMKKIVRFST